MPQRRGNTVLPALKKPARPILARLFRGCHIPVVITRKDTMRFHDTQKAQTLLLLLAALLSASCTTATGSSSGQASSSSGATGGSSNAASTGGSSAGGSSGAVTSSSLPGTTNHAALVLTELSGASEDWVELLNTSAEGVQLYGLRLTDDDQGQPNVPDAMDFPALVLGAGQRLVVVAAQAVPGEGLQARCLVQGGPATCLHALWGVSNGTGDTLYLLDANNQTLTQAILPPDGAPTGTTWCRVPDEDGPFGSCIPTPGTANARNTGGSSSSSGGVASSSAPSSSSTESSSSATQSSSLAGSSSAVVGSSSAAGSSSSGGAPAGVVINEVTSLNNDEIELFNNSGDAVDVSGWTVLDAGATSTAYTFPAASTLAAGGRTVLVKNTHHTFGLGTPDTVTLRNTAGDVVDVVSWTAAIASSRCRLPDGTGAFTACTATFGAPNMP